MIDNTAVEEELIKFDGVDQAIIVALKQSTGKMFVDVRKWNHVYGHSNEYMPSKGVMISVDQWPRVIESVNNMLSKSHNV